MVFLFYEFRSPSMSGHTKENDYGVRGQYGK